MVAEVQPDLEADHDEEESGLVEGDDAGEEEAESKHEPEDAAEQDAVDDCLVEGDDAGEEEAESKHKPEDAAEQDAVDDFEDPFGFGPYA